MSMGPDRFPKVPTPLALADAGLDSVAVVIMLPGRVISSLAGGVQQAADGFNAGVARPTSGAAPATPDVVFSGLIQAGTGVINGLVGAITGAINDFVATGEGVRREVEQIVPR